MEPAASLRGRTHRQVHRSYWEPLPLSAICTWCTSPSSCSTRRLPGAGLPSTVMLSGAAPPEGPSVRTQMA